MVILNLKDRVKVVKETFFKRFITEENFLYQIELIEKLSEKCYNANRKDLSIELDKFLLEGKQKILYFHFFNSIDNEEKFLKQLKLCQTFQTRCIKLGRLEVAEELSRVMFNAEENFRKKRKV